MACQASPELAEAGEIVLIPIAKTSNVRTINIILLLSNCLSCALAHTGLGFPVDDFHRAHARDLAAVPDSSRPDSTIVV
jgi:hypothetical protein